MIAWISRNLRVPQLGGVGVQPLEILCVIEASRAKVCAFGVPSVMYVTVLLTLTKIRDLLCHCDYEDSIFKALSQG